MPRPIKESIGICTCSVIGCGETAEVKRLGKSGLLYLVCPVCGSTSSQRGRALQDYILDHATMNTPTAVHEAAPAAEPETPAPVPASVPVFSGPDSCTHNQKAPPEPAPEPEKPEPEPEPKPQKPYKPVNASQGEHAYKEMLKGDTWLF